MKKIGIVTHSNSTNYGGILQAVALSHTLKGLETEPVNITCQKMPPAWKKMYTYVKQRTLHYGCKGLNTKLRICGGMLKTLLSNVHYFDVKKKQKQFKTFISENLTVTPYYKTDEELRKNCAEFDVYITGSDQVWNASFSNELLEDKFFLGFAPKGKPLYSYAASAGGTKSDDYVQEIIYRTKGFSGITVREKSLECQMKKLGAVHVKTIIDPVFLLTKEEWEKYERNPEKNIPQKYILSYFLEKTEAQDCVINKVASELQLPVVDILPQYKKTAYKRIIDSTAGPAEFIWYMHHAQYIITNSFHMIAFSLIFGKKFISLQRPGQESRIEDILDKFNIKDHLIHEESEWSNIRNDVARQDIINKIIPYRKEGVSYLEKMKG